MEKKPLNEGYQPMGQGNFGYQPNGEVERRGYQPSASNLNVAPTLPRGGSSVKPAQTTDSKK